MFYFLFFIYHIIFFSFWVTVYSSKINHALKIMKNKNIHMKVWDRMQIINFRDSIQRIGQNKNNIPTLIYIKMHVKVLRQKPTILQKTRRF